MNKTYIQKLGDDFRRNKVLYLMFLPVLAYYVLFCYKPMYGIIMAFTDYKVIDGYWGSDWVGLKNFIDYFENPYFFRTVRNTIVLNLMFLFFSFPCPICLALLLNEVKNTVFKRTVQTVTYLPHFISTVVICGMLSSFSLSSGLFNDIIVFFGGERSSLLSDPKFYRPLYVISGMWREMGWNSIIYLAALSGVDAQLYEAAKIDGASKWKQTLHVTLPGILPTIVIKLILQIGGLMSLGNEKALLLYNSAIYETADMISTYSYRMGLEQLDYSYGTAIDLFNAVINIFLVVMANKISKKVTDSSLW
jgi:putative aldouronate transport system permease protein